MIWSRFCSVSTFDYLVAAVSTAVISVAIAYSIYLFAPWGCDASAWLCLFRISLLGVAPIGAICLPLLFRLNRQRHRAFPDGWLPFVVSVAIVSQVAVTGYSFWLFEDHIRRIFFYEILIFPQGLAAGAVTGAAFWCSLAILNKRRARLHRRD
ncbi:hypothetical protein [Ovoidimarina sediminis]|uniref:hypothetical protein n=1 Tax=Ovoidimarina sediminis TaxID=3079856 RepID=UPI002914DC73|nr:hypothetical protein [Rhodophyticola sp. MJ-SS7]MDU8946475.1 hypothetical protein [Rhodophyticola sp. MJ-SS7]